MDKREKNNKPLNLCDYLVGISLVLVFAIPASIYARAFFDDKVGLTPLNVVTAILAVPIILLTALNVRSDRAKKSGEF